MHSFYAHLVHLATVRSARFRPKAQALDSQGTTQLMGPPHETPGLRGPVWPRCRLVGTGPQRLPCQDPATGGGRCQDTAPGWLALATILQGPSAQDASVPSGGMTGPRVSSGS